jgi:hypothetical protein
MFGRAVLMRLFLPPDQAFEEWGFFSCGDFPDKNFGGVWLVFVQPSIDGFFG